ncbi:translation initiation factor IF-2 N-terminal domain-containing protein, partial [Helicobacter rodentium]
MDKIRISEIAKELGKTSKEVLQKAQELGFESKTASSSVTTEQAAILYDYIVSGVNPTVESVTTNLKEGKKSTKAKKASEETKNKTPKKEKAKEKEKAPAPKTIDKEAKKTHKETSRIKKDSAKNNQE